MNGNESYGLTGNIYIYIRMVILGDNREKEKKEEEEEKESEA